jgi:hypothetical protein
MDDHPYWERHAATVAPPFLLRNVDQSGTGEAQDGRERLREKRLNTA